MPWFSIVLFSIGLLRLYVCWFIVCVGVWLVGVGGGMGCIGFSFRFIPCCVVLIVMVCVFVVILVVVVFGGSSMGYGIAGRLGVPGFPVGWDPGIFIVVYVLFFCFVSCSCGFGGCMVICICCVFGLYVMVFFVVFFCCVLLCVVSFCVGFFSR